MKYTIPGISTIVAALLWLGEQWLSQVFNNFPNIPWGWLLVCALMLLLGVIYADVLNENSNIRRWFKGKTKIFDLEHFVLAHKAEDGKAWYEAVIQIRFLSSFKNISSSIQITQYVGLPHAVKSFVILQEEISSVEKNLLKKIVVAKFPIRVAKEIAPGYPIWGHSTDHSWAGDGNHIVTLKVKTGFRRQTRELLVSAIKDVGMGPEPVLLFGGPNNESYINVCNKA